MTNLLINEPPLMVLPRLAKAIGLNEAIILQQIHYWLDPRMNKNKREGVHWVYNTYKDWKKQFPFWPEITIKRTILSLEKKNLIISSCYNKNSLDKTKWYTINYKELSLISQEIQRRDQNDPIDRVKMIHRTDQNDPIIYKETETTTKITNSSLNPSSLQNCNVDKKEKGEEENINLKNREGFKKNPNSLESSEAPVSSSPQREVRKEFERSPIAESMLKTWDAIVKEGQGTSYLQAKRQENLLHALETYFDNKPENWEGFCKKIASSKFLMGEEKDSNFKSIKLDWVLKPEVTEKILEGSYTLGDRDVWPNNFGEEEQNNINTYEAKALKLIQEKDLSWENALKSCFFGRVYNLGEGRDIQILLRKEGFDHPQVQEKFKCWKQERVLRVEQEEQQEKADTHSNLLGKGIKEIQVENECAPKTSPQEACEEPIAPTFKVKATRPLFEHSVETNKKAGFTHTVIQKAEIALKEKIKTTPHILESDFKKVFELRILQKEEGKGLYEAWKANDYKWCEKAFSPRYQEWKQGLLKQDALNPQDSSSQEDRYEKSQTGQGSLNKEVEKPLTPWQQIKEKESRLIEKITCHKVKEKDYKEALEFRIKEGIEGSADYKLFKLYGWGSKAGFDKMLEEYKQRMVSKAAKHHNNPETLALFSVNKYEKAELGYLKH